MKNKLFSSVAEPLGLFLQCKSAVVRSLLNSTSTMLIAAVKFANEEGSFFLCLMFLSAFLTLQ